MEKSEQQFIVSLLDKDPELKHYYEEHQELEEKLVGFQHRPHLSPAEELEKKKLQKLKLAGKDKMMEILGKYRQSGMQRESE
jgi:uncharacterized protein YdcH (DUF465 family)